MGITTEDWRAFGGKIKDFFSAPQVEGPDESATRIGWGNRNHYGGMGRRYDNRHQALNADPQSQMRDDQRALIEQMQARASGEAPSAAEAQMMQALERNRAGAQSMALSNPSVDPAMAQRMAQQQQAQMGMQVGQQAAQMRAQEQGQAQQALAQMLQGARGQDIGFAQAQGQNYLQQQAQNDAMKQFFEQLGYTADEASRQAQLQMEQMQQQAAATNAQLSQQNKQGWLGFLGSGLGALGSLF